MCHCGDYGLVFKSSGKLSLSPEFKGLDVLLKTIQNFFHTMDIIRKQTKTVKARSHKTILYHTVIWKLSLDAMIHYKIYDLPYLPIG